MKKNYPENNLEKDRLKILDIQFNDKINKLEEISKLFSSKDIYQEDSFRILEEVVKHSNTNYCFLYSSGFGKYFEHLIEENLKNYEGLDKKDLDNNTFLIHAAKNGHINVVKKLLEMGFSPNEKNKFGHDAREYAFRKGHKEIVELLN